MIFVTVGSQKFQFNRLLKWIDELIESNIIKEEVVAQIGESTYVPCNYRSEKFFSREEMFSLTKKSRLVISHCGTGAIITTLKNRGKIIAVPRLKEYKEHVDNHQLEIADVLSKKEYILVAQTKVELINQLDKSKYYNFKKFSSGKDKYHKFLINYIENWV